MFIILRKLLRVILLKISNEFYYNTIESFRGMYTLQK